MLTKDLCGYFSTKVHDNKIGTCHLLPSIFCSERILNSCLALLMAWVTLCFGQLHCAKMEMVFVLTVAVHSR